jgi:hypothetical protein
MPGPTESARTRRHRGDASSLSNSEANKRLRRTINNHRSATQKEWKDRMLDHCFTANNMKMRLWSRGVELHRFGDVFCRAL